MILDNILLWWLDFNSKLINMVKCSYFKSYNFDFRNKKKRKEIARIE